jgi:hypothetical protein
MDFDTIFQNYYSLYRGESDTPASTDDEYTVALRLANNAVARWANVDGVLWKELFTNLQAATDGDKVIVAGDSTYAAPTNMKRSGGFVRILNADGTTKTTYQIIEPQEAQFKNDNQTYCYFTGDPNNGFVLHLNESPNSDIDGLSIDYVYYKKPTEFAQGSDTSECPNPWFIIHNMLANRWRISQNYGSYQTALRDAEEALKNMQQDFAAGTWANPWELADNSGSVWGI